MAQAFNAIRWLASEVLLRHGALERLVNGGLDAFMADCPYGDLPKDQRGVVEALLCNVDAIDALADYWVAYDGGRADGSIPAVKSPWLD